MAFDPYGQNFLRRILTGLVPGVAPTLPKKHLQLSHSLLPQLTFAFRFEIGRASCRERV